MKNIFPLYFIILFLSCTGSNSEKANNENIYRANNISIDFNPETNITYFSKKGEPLNGTVTQKMKDGFKSTWQVENGLGTKQTVYYKNGAVERILEMKEGVEHGMFVMFFPDGKKYVEQSYENGKPVGTWKRWNISGELAETKEH